MRNILRIALPALATATAVTVPAPGEARTFRMGHVFEVNHPYHQAALQAAKHFNTCTKGAHSIDIYPASQLGSDNDMNEQIKIGGVDATITGFIFAANSHPPLALAAAPFMFRDREHALKYMRSDLFKQAWAGWNKATGQHILSAGFFGFFNVTSKTPITKPEDMRGLKIRVPNMPIYLAFPKAVGANPTPIPLHEVYLALQQGVAEASSNGLSMTYAHRFYEVQNYVNTTGHMVDYTLWVSSDTMMKALDDAGRKCLQEAADLWGSEGTRGIHELETGLKTSLVKEGKIKFNEPDVSAFRERTSGAIDEFAKMLGVDPAVVKAIQNL